MSYITVPDEDEVKKTIPTLKHSTDIYVGNTVDSRLKNVNTISTYIQGQRWIVDWYKQILNRDDAASTHSDRSLHVHKQYREIRGVPLIVQSELQDSQGSDGQRSFERVGTSSVPYELTPTEGDIIIADIGDGEEMEFTVTSTERTSIYPEAYIDVSYRAVRVVDSVARQAIDSRVVERLFYSVDNQRTGLKSLLTSEEANLKRDLSKLYSVLARRYIRDFVSNKYVTLIVPGQKDIVYDPYITRFVKAVVDATSFPEVHDINLMYLNGDEASDEETFWDCLINVDLTPLRLLPSKTDLVSVNSFRTRPVLNSIYFSGIEKVVRVLDYGFTVNQGINNRVSHGNTTKAGARSDELRDIIPVQNLNKVAEEYSIKTGSGLPYINRVVKDDYYVLSKSFYEDKVPTSELEKLIIDRLDKGSMDLSVLSKIAEFSLRFDNLERFYYTPIILALLRLSDGVL